MKKVLLVLLIISTLFLTSCIKMDSHLIINDDLSIEGKTVFDYTGINGMSSGISNSFGTGTTMEEPKKSVCDQLESGTGGMSMGLFDNPVCSDINENVAEVSGKGDSLKERIEIKDGNYYLNLGSITEANSKDDGMSKEEKEQQILGLKTMGFEMNYTIEFPTDIIDTNIGQFEGKILKFNIFDTIGESTPYVIFKNNGKLDITEKEIVEKISVKLETKVRLFKKLILSKKELEKTFKGRNDKIKYDKIIPKATNNKLIELNDRISKIDRTNPLFKKYEDIFNYLEAKVGLEIYKRNEAVLKKDINNELDKFIETIN